MSFSWRLSGSLLSYILKNKLRGRQRFPLTLMLEPLLRCNLACAGCGRIREYRAVLDRMMTVEECLGAVAEAGAPVVSITGGEPLLHPDIDRIVAGIIARRRFVYLCTNGLLLEANLHRFRPGPYMSFVLHLDGPAPVHDAMAGRDGVFESALRAIKAAKKAGFRVLTNTTLYRTSRPEETMGLLATLQKAGVDGLMVSPAFSYEAVTTNVFLNRQEVAARFLPLYQRRRQLRLYNSSPYLRFLSGELDLACSPWSTPTRNPAGWRRPCYLLADSHCGTFQELMNETPWERYGAGADPRCANCMVHCGFEASGILRAFSHPRELWCLARWEFGR